MTSLYQQVRPVRPRRATFTSSSRKERPDKVWWGDSSSLLRWLRQTNTNSYFRGATPRKPQPSPLSQPALCSLACFYLSTPMLCLSLLLLGLCDYACCCCFFVFFPCAEGGLNINKITMRSLISIECGVNGSSLSGMMLGVKLWWKWGRQREGGQRGRENTFQSSRRQRLFSEE